MCGYVISLAKILVYLKLQLLAGNIGVAYTQKIPLLYAFIRAVFSIYNSLISRVVYKPFCSCAEECIYIRCSQFQVVLQFMRQVRVGDECRTE